MRFDNIEEEIIYSKLMNGSRQPEITNMTSENVSDTIPNVAFDSLDTNKKTNDYMAEISQKIATMEITRVNYPDYIMPTQPIYRPIKKARYYAKKAIRKSVNWALGTAYDRQTEFNNAVVPAIGRLTELQSMTFELLEKEKRQNDYTIERVTACENQGEETKQALESFTEQITLLANQNEDMKQAMGQSAEQIASIENQNEEMKQIIGRSVEKIASIENQNEEMKQIIGRSVEQIASIENQNEDMKQTIGRSADKVMALENQNQEIKQTMGQSVERILSLEKQIAFLEGKAQTLEQWFLQSTQMMQSVQDGLKTMEELGVLRQIQRIKKEDETNNFAKRTLSQSGEDVILSYILNTRGISPKDCTYLDLGANHAKQYSNTYYFYDKGARGVLVEANPALIPELKLYRNEDVVLNCCISDTDGDPIDFYVLNGDGLSTPDKKRVDEVISLNPTLKIDRIVSVKTMTVNEILRTYFDKAPVYLNIDLEGDDIAILSSIDWDEYRPLMISIEMIPYRPCLVVGNKNEEILRFMEDKEYIEYAFTGINSIFLDKRQIKDVLV